MNDKLRQVARPGTNNGGAWNPALNDPSLADGSGVDQIVYYCDRDGTADHGGGRLIAYRAGDYTTYKSGDAQWHRIAAAATFTSVKTADYIANAGEIVQVDTTGGAVRVSVPEYPSIGDTIGVQKVSTGTTPAVEIYGNGNNLVPIRSLIVSLDQAFLFGFYESVAYTWDGTNWTVTNAAKISRGINVYSATPIVDASADVIQWTFIPTYPGQVPTLFSLAAGVFTSNGQAELSIGLSGEWTFRLQSNNSDSEFSVTPALVDNSGSGALVLPRIIQPFAHARSGNFTQNGNTDGLVEVGVSDTLTFTAASLGDPADLDELYLILKG